MPQKVADSIPDNINEFVEWCLLGCYAVYLL
jgi:hypothetical protein